LSKWLYIFVEDHEVVERTCLPTKYKDDYWEKRYCLRMNKVPVYLNVIQQCALEISQPVDCRTCQTVELAGDGRQDQHSQQQAVL
jgi:hypothetical protein